MDFIVAHVRLKEKDARRFFRQVVQAIDYCHSLHVIRSSCYFVLFVSAIVLQKPLFWLCFTRTNVITYVVVLLVDRDLKAENLLLDSQFRVKVIDFGLSNCYTPGDLMQTFCGSPTYTAPELIKRQKYEVCSFQISPLVPLCAVLTVNLGSGG
jgi:serine/threonine protein kinase